MGETTRRRKGKRLTYPKLLTNLQREGGAEGRRGGGREGRGVGGREGGRGGGAEGGWEGRGEGGKGGGTQKLRVF